MDKINVTVLGVNAQQGLFLTDDNQIVAAYSHYKKEVRFKIPYTSNDVVLPESYSDYKLLNRTTDSISLTFWTDQGYKDL